MLRAVVFASPIFAALGCLTPAAQDRSALAGLVELDGEAYRAARAELIGSGRRLPDEAEGLAGVALHLLRHRSMAQRRFAEWDALRPEPTRGGVAYFRAEPPDAAGLAFLLEQAWKGEGRARDVAAGEFVLWVRNRRLPRLAWQAALALADGGTTEALRRIGHLALGASGEASAAPAIHERLGDPRLGLAHADMLLVGLWAAQPEWAATAVLSADEALRRSAQLQQSAFAVLASAAGDGARAALRDRIDDRERDPFVRLLALEACAAVPRPGDAAVIGRFLAEPLASVQAERAIHLLPSHPYAEAAPVLRAVLQDADPDPRRLHAAVFALARLHQPGPPLAPRARALDIAALRRAIASGRTSDAARARAELLLETLSR